MTMSSLSEQAANKIRQSLHRLHDPLAMMVNRAPVQTSRLVLKAVAVLVIVLVLWAAFGKLDIIASASGKLVPQTLVKIVQPAESGVVRELLVNEGDHVVAGEVLMRLDPTLIVADKQGIASDLAHQQMQQRRLLAALENQPMQMEAGDDAALYAQVHNQFLVQRQAFTDERDHETSLLSKARNDYASAIEIRNKLRQSLPMYEQSANAYSALHQQGFLSALAAADKEREVLEKTHDLQAQEATVASLKDAMSAQQKRLDQLRSHYRHTLEIELASVREKITQLQPTLDKSVYREGLMVLTAPQDGVIKDLSTTTVGAVVQPGSVLMTLVPHNEQLFADVNIHNEDVGFVQVGQHVQLKLAAYPFQKYGMVYGEVVHLGADANDQSKGEGIALASSYKARIALQEQGLTKPNGDVLPLTAGMQVISEIHQGQRTVLEYFLSPVQKVVQEAARER